MDLFDRLDALERTVRESPSILFTQLKALNREEFDRLLLAARQEVERVRRERPALPSRDEVLRQTESESQAILEVARQKANEVLRQDRIRSLSRQHANAVLSEGKQRAASLIRDAYAYTLERLSRIDGQLSRLNEQVAASLGIVKQTARTAREARRQREKQAARYQARERRRKLRQIFFG